MTDTVSEPIIEGFICPNCMKSFSTVELLKFHFHSDHKFDVEAEPQTKQRTRPSLNNKIAGPIPASFAFYDQGSLAQPLGQTRSLLPEFTHLRRCRVSRDALETNSLLIRLEKLLSESSTISANQRREFEQSVVPWVGAKIDLCPSCGEAFGLGLELAYPALVEETQADVSPTQTTSSHLKKLEEVAQRSKQKLTQFTNALLDYNPVFRRRHHCRLCGHVLCADCSFFLPRTSGLRILEVVNTSSIASRPTDLPAHTESDHEAVQQPIFLKSSEVARPIVNIDREVHDDYMLRVCGVCKDLLKRKLDRLEVRLQTCPLVRMHEELRKHMNRVRESLPVYTEMAESLHSGGQKYALEVAKNMRHELIESMQNIDLLRRKFDDLITHSVGPQGVKKTGPMNLASVRLARAISKMARQFLQVNLPPLRALPTLQQYDSLAAQRKDELAARWEEEDRALAQLERRVAAQSQTTAPATDSHTQNPSSVERMAQLAASIDSVSAQLRSALARNERDKARQFDAELNRLEWEFQSLSTSIQNLN